MTIGHLWLPILDDSAPAGHPTLLGSNQIFNRTSPYAQPLPVTTNAGDCIIINVGNRTNHTGTVVGSGAGATWTTYESPDHKGSLVVGVNASAGQTSCTLTIGTDNIDTNCTVWSHIATVAPVTANVEAESVSTANSVTSPSISYGANQLLIAGSNSPLGRNLVSGVWSNGIATTLVPAAGDSMAIDYINPSSSGSTTFTNGNFSGTDTYIVNVLAMTSV